ncbi:3D domain-containing protein [Algisphaera agarilytica]|uniref:3D (Asp-Asp-Asp) domain-containing protein n=1 Tax=Algisphaera agarilytica TaxID=1385975 RepID=A0A7X0H6C0_9BACT|nr:3D domain-containing protein [Algisphaera agarilytica]MBB6428589.1 3D (Asp-Asp-Asp) domain-containing protein [Algisphaera agarilytica]
MPRIPSPQPGSRETQPFALALAAVVVTGTTVVAVTLIWGVVAGLRGGDSIELMSIEDPTATPTAEQILSVETLAPSRPAPELVIPEVVLPDAALLVREQQLIEATEDQGPALGDSLPTPVIAPGAAPTFDGRPLRPVQTVRMLTTAYSPDARSCGKWADGITASGYSVWTNGMKLAAADTSLFPFGTIITVPGYNKGRPVPVLDRGGVIKGHRLDLLYPTHEVALEWGAQRLDVTIWEYAD